MRVLFLVSLCFCLIACNQESTSLEDFNTRPVTLPDGTTIKAEFMMNRVDMNKGMMFRDTFPEGRGMVFVHPTPDRYPYWMYQVKMPIDIIWLDKNRQVVEIVENAPPCKTRSSECPNFGGTEIASYVLELPGGYGRKHGIVKGAFVRF